MNGWLTRFENLPRNPRVIFDYEDLLNPDEFHGPAMDFWWRPDSRLIIRQAFTFFTKHLQDSCAYICQPMPWYIEKRHGSRSPDYFPDYFLATLPNSRPLRHRHPDD
jgi:hypothetical protein